MHLLQLPPHQYKGPAEASLYDIYAEEILKEIYRQAKKKIWKSLSVLYRIKWQALPTRDEE